MTSENIRVSATNVHAWIEAGLQQMNVDKFITEMVKIDTDHGIFYDLTVVPAREEVSVNS